MKRFISITSVLFWIASSCYGIAAESFDVLDETEKKAVSDTFQFALENNPSGQASTWVNPDNVYSGEIKPVRTYQNSHGEPCREFTQTIIIDNREEIGYGTACRQPDGSWQIVAGQVPSTVLAGIKPAENRTIVYINATPWPNYFLYIYGAPYGVWYPYDYPRSFFFSFNHVYHKGRYYRRSAEPAPHHYNRYNLSPNIRTDYDRYRPRPKRRDKEGGGDRPLWRNEPRTRQGIESEYRDETENRSRRRSESGERR